MIIIITAEDVGAVPQCEEVIKKKNEFYILNLYKNSLFETDLLDIKAAVINTMCQNSSNDMELDIFNDEEDINKNNTTFYKKKTKIEKKIKKKGVSSSLHLSLTPGQMRFQCRHLLQAANLHAAKIKERKLD